MKLTNQIAPGSDTYLIFATSKSYLAAFPARGAINLKTSTLIDSNGAMRLYFETRDLPPVVLHQQNVAKERFKVGVVDGTVGDGRGLPHGLGHLEKHNITTHNIRVRSLTIDDPYVNWAANSASFSKK